MPIIEENTSQVLKPFTQKDISNFYRGTKLGRFNPIAKKMLYSFNRLFGKFSHEDRIRIACSCEPPMFFLRNGIMVPHPFGVSFSIDEVGCDCCIGQNVTIGSSGENMGINERTATHKPRIGNLVRVYSHAVIAGEINIGDCVIVSASSVVTQDVPSKSIVYGTNQIRPLKVGGILNHVVVGLLRVLFYNCVKFYIRVPGLMYKDEKMYINTEYLNKRNLLIESLETDDFPRLLDELF
jgi:serine acetyltransferase